MTESDWLHSDDLLGMLRYAGPLYTLRCARLFAVACCRASIELVRSGNDHLWFALLALERQADDNQPVPVRVRQWVDHHWTMVPNETFDAQRFAAVAVHQLLRVERYSGASNVTPSNARWPLQMSIHDDELRLNGLHNAGDLHYLQRHCSTLRDILGNPFAPVRIEPVWCTANVVALAQSIYHGHAFEQFPFLGDALMDAGCEDETMIAHCRQTTHVRGCWLLDALLSKR